MGSIVCQLARHSGCKVIGIAGNQVKCDFLVNELGIDGAINYKNNNVAEELKPFVLKGSTYISITSVAKSLIMRWTSLDQELGLSSAARPRSTKPMAVGMDQKIISTSYIEKRSCRAFTFSTIEIDSLMPIED